MKHSEADIQRWLVQYLASVLKLSPETIDARQPFSSYGLSSRESLELIGDLEDWFGSDCADTLIYDFPTIERLSGHLAGPACAQ